MDIKIRKAEEKDFPLLLKLIKEFALYLGKSEQVKTSIDDFKQDKDNFTCLLAENSSDEIVGYALYFNTFHTWTGKAIYLEDLFVKDEYRNKSIGKMLMYKLIDVARQTNCKNIKWEVLNWNTNAIDFYKKLGATVGDDNLKCNFIVK